MSLTREQIEALKVFDVEPRRSFQAKDGPVVYLRDLCDLALAGLAAPKWIPCSERLPSKWPFVVRWNDDVAEHICDRYEAINHDPDWLSPKDCLDWSKATHWMELPAGPTP